MDWNGSWDDGAVNPSNSKTSSLEKPANRGIAFAWILVALATGLLPSFRDIDYKDFTPLLGFFLLLALWSLNQFKQFFFRWSNLETFLLLYLAWACLSLLWSATPSAGMDFLGRWLPWAGLYLLARQDQDSRRSVETAWFWVLILSCLYGFAQKFLWNYVPHLPGAEPDRIYSLFGNPNVFAAFLVLSWPVLLLKPIHRSNKQQILLRAASVILVFLNLDWTDSRAGYLALEIQVILLMVLVGAKYFHKSVGWGKIVMVLVGIAVAIFFAAGIGNRPTERLEVWRCTAHMAMEKPVIGWGVNQFSLGFPNFMSDELKGQFQKDNTFAEHAHNEPLELWVELGVVGLVLALLFWGTLLWKARGALCSGRKGSDPLDLSSLGLFIGLAGAGFTNLFDYNCRLSGVGFFIWIVAAWLANRYEPGKIIRFSSGVGKTMAAVFLVLSIIGFTFSIPAVYARVAAPSTQDFLKDLPADLPGEKQRLEAAIVQNPKDADLYHRLGNVDAKLSLMDQAESAYKNEIALNPAASGAYLNLGNVYFFKADKNSGNLDQAIAYYSQCVVLDPNSVEGHYNLAYALFVKKEMKAALGQLDEVLRLDPRNDHALSLKRQILP